MDYKLEGKEKHKSKFLKKTRIFVVLTIVLLDYIFIVL